MIIDMKEITLKHCDDGKCFKAFYDDMRQQVYCYRINREILAAFGFEIIDILEDD